MSKEAFPRTDDGRPTRAEQVDRARGALSTSRFGGAASSSSESVHRTGDSCEDDDEGVRRAAMERGHPEVTGCVDVGGYCGLDDPMGNGVRRLCCVTCTAPTGPLAESLPPSGGGPVDLYLLAGQSGCVGLSSVAAMRASKKYATLDKEQPGVWFAGYRGLQTADNFAIAPMSPGVGSGGASTFGPELALGERLHALTGRPVVLMKYCWGGSDVRTDWNPSTWENGWDRRRDNGSAAWLLSRGGANLGRRVMAFKNWVYTYRRTTEALAAAGVKVHTKGLFWMQGAADDQRQWYEYGVDETRAIDALRCSVGQYTLPVVSQGSNAINQLRSGKALTEASVEGCKLQVLETANLTLTLTLSLSPGLSLVLAIALNLTLTRCSRRRSPRSGLGRAANRGPRTRAWRGCTSTSTCSNSTGTTPSSPRRSSRRARPPRSSRGSATWSTTCTRSTTRRYCWGATWPTPTSGTSAARPCPRRTTTRTRRCASPGNRARRARAPRRATSAGTTCARAARSLPPRGAPPSVGRCRRRRPA